MIYDELSRNAENIWHIALIIPTLDRIGGAERQVMHLAAELARRGHRITLIVLSGSPSVHLDLLVLPGTSCMSLGMRKAWIDPRGWLRYLRWARENRPDIVHAHLPHASWFARWVRLAAPVRVVIDSIHTSRTSTPLKQFGYRLSNWLSNHTTCVSQSVARVASRAKLVASEKISVVANGVMLSEYSSKIESNVTELQCADPAPFVWIACGRLEPVKDYPTLLRAFAQLFDEPILKIIGAGSNRDFLEHLARELSIEERVEFTGFLHDVRPALGAADAFVLSSLWEGLPVGILEAQAAELPVVATDGAGTSEALVDGQTGFLVPVGNVEALAAAMARTMDMSPDQRCRVGTLGRAFVKEFFALTAVVDRWERLYKELLDSHSQRHRWSRSDYSFPI